MDVAVTRYGKDMDMDHVRRGTLLILIVVVLAAALIWYYFAKVYDGDASVRGTLVEQTVKPLEIL